MLEKHRGVKAKTCRLAFSLGRVMIRWLLFDIGDVLLIEEPMSTMRWEVLYRAVKDAGYNMTFTDLMARREKLVHENQNNIPQDTIALELLGESGRADIKRQIQAKLREDFMGYQFLLKGTKEILRELSSRYKLAMAANQPKQVFRQAMEDAGILGFFDVAGISDEIGFSKPDLRFFEAVLAEAGCLASEAIMIGDRIDNDIAPAQKLGMQTIWFNLSPEARGYIPKSDFERVYFDSLRRAPSRGTGHPNEQIEPSVTVTSLDQLVEAIEVISEKVRKESR